ncbi:DUF4296 domain-containing protein [Formosa haliotis]|uniref:DUF4296 domain-containing protein n=1 Tax=Formosa haliotis TaxID=1555194 RepID=UPI00082551A7|nr:DUF4296 domain-containing protein [Formosa haliotis]
MKQVILGLCLLLISASCHQVKRPEKPKNLIPKAEMVNIIIDINLLSASKGIDRNALESHGVTVQNYIYDKYNIDSLQLAKSNEYYAYDIDEFEALYVKVEDSLTRLKDKFEKEKEELREKKRISDSLKKEQISGTKLKPMEAGKDANDLIPDLKEKAE